MAMKRPPDNRYKADTIKEEDLKYKIKKPNEAKKILRAISHGVIRSPSSKDIHFYFRAHNRGGSVHVLGMSQQLAYQVAHKILKIIDEDMKEVLHLENKEEE